MTTQEDLVDVADRSNALPVMAFLEAHVPLSLLMDLALAGRVRSEEVFAAEPAELSWLSAAA